MLANYLKTSLRTLWRHKGYTLINMLGLAIGMASVLLILLFVRSELSYDVHHEHRDNIYLLAIHGTNPQTGEKNQRAIGPYRLKDELDVDFSDFEHIVRIADMSQEQVVVEDENYLENELAFVDPEVLQVFSFPLIEGNKLTALDDPNSLVLTEAIAKKYFGNQNPMGQTVQIRDQEFKVTGIMAAPPEQTQFPYEILVSMNSAQQVFGRIVLENWGEGYVYTFVQKSPEQSSADLDRRFEDFVAAKLKVFERFSPKIVMHPMESLYLDSASLNGWIPGGDRTYVLAFTFIAIFILIIACINFINLATARSSVRAREIGLRKVVGAERTQLIGQFLTESILLSVICMLLATLLAKAFLPTFNVLANRTLELPLWQNPSIWFALGLIALLVGILAGIYPALVLSGYQPIKVLSSKIQTRLRGVGLRRLLVTFQFTASILLLIITVVVGNQLDYCKNMDLGFDKDHLLVFPTPNELRGRYDQFRTELMSHPNIINAAGSSRVPPGRLSSSLRARPEGVPESEQRGMQTVWTDYDFIETMGLEMASGRSFSRDFPADASTGFVLNEAAVKAIGWTNETAINKSFGSSEIKDWNSGQWENRDGKVIGVLKDFHFESLREEIIPTVYFVAPYMAWNYVIRFGNQNISETLAHIEEVWESFNPQTPLDYQFVDERFAQLYANEERQGNIFAIFASLAIFIACLGLVGLASFTATRKRKELSIRKVLGAAPQQLILLLSKEFTLLIGIAFLIASPLAWYIIRDWLASFAYQAPLGIEVFMLSGLITLGIAWLTVAYHIGRAALNNPVSYLRQE